MRPGLPDSHLVLLAHRQPLHLLPRVDLALLEGYGYDGETSACSTSSGMAAIAAATQPFLVHQEKHVHEPRNFLATAQCYGGTFQLFNIRYMEERGIECRWIEDPTNVDEWASKIDKNTRFLYGELPSNPAQGFFDIEAVADLAHSHNLPLICDNTVGTPALLRPICHGADLVVQSVTKTLTTSGFGVAGAVISKGDITTTIPNEAMKKDFSLYIKYLPNRDTGPNLHPMQAITSLNDIRTLRSKVDMMSRSTLKIAQWLSEHDMVESVDYLGLPNHPRHELASKYMWLVDAESDPLYGQAGESLRPPDEFLRQGRPPEHPHLLRRHAADLAGDGPGPHQVGGDDPRDLDAPAAGRGGPQARRDPAEHGAAVRRRRTPRRCDRRPRPGAELHQDINAGIHGGRECVKRGRDQF
jgi:hypothetical protein